MINVAFLLLIFFLMAAAIPPIAEEDLSPPVSASEAEPGEGQRLVLRAGHILETGDLVGRDIVLRVDAATPGAEVAAALARLKAAGARGVSILAIHDPISKEEN